ncbi:type 1 fimbrial protein [Enterobacter asburiae]|nr:type 1 fimbrial protein [Enterobacter asburiae]RTP71327.1 type 1 fimbrial protein [Enterobacter asburiae]RTP98245.1 type 1 fimbrial protein [Enterobacter asburiae]HAS1939869.1 type 1 fimbrial protein [Enterobacter asburiae]
MVMIMFNVNKFFLSSTACIFLAAGIVHSAFAVDPVQITVTGNIVASPCVIDTGSESLDIPLGDQLQSADLNAAGSGSAWVPINVIFKSCPAGTSTITATFHGTADAGDPNTLYSNTAVDAGENKAAKNIAVQLEGLADEAYGNGKTATIDIASAGATPTFKMHTRAFSKDGGATPGKISSVITMSFTYN